jgi:hypothetical protein
MEANDTAVKFLKAEERMQNFLFTLSKPCEEGKVIQVKKFSSGRREMPGCRLFGD